MAATRYIIEHHCDSRASFKPPNEVRWWCYGIYKNRTRAETIAKREAAKADYYLVLRVKEVLLDGPLIRTAYSPDAFGDFISGPLP